MPLNTQEHTSKRYDAELGSLRAVLADRFDALFEGGRDLPREEVVKLALRATAAIGDREDQRRRFVILSLLERGLDVAAYRQRFASEASDDLPELDELLPLGLGQRDERGIRLTDEGLERSDLIGQWLYSTRVRERMAAYVAR